MNARMRGGIAAISVPNYRWILLNQFAQSAGITAEALATGWLVLLLTDSPFWLGVVVGSRGAAQLLFSAVGGAIADRSDLRAVLMRNHLMSAVLWSCIVVLAQTGAIQLWHLLVASATAGLLHAMNAPATNSLTYAAVGPDRLLNANAFGFLARGVVRVISALAGGYAIASLGLPATYALVVAAALAGFSALLPVRGISATVRALESPIASLLNGLRYAARTPQVRRMLLFSLATEVFGFSYMHMLPVVARDILGVGPVGLGSLTAAAGAGQLVAMAGLASLGDVRNKHRLLLGSTIGLGLSIVVFAAMRSLPLALATLFVVGGVAGVYDSAMTTVIQMVVAPEMRGRVLGLLAATWGGNQVGGTGVGALSLVWGTPIALVSCGALVALNGLRLLPRASLFDPASVEGPTASR